MKALVDISLTAILYFIITTAYADNMTASTSQSIEGNYKCQWNGSLLDNKSFSLTISKTGDTYNSEWDDNTGNPVLYGTGLMGSNINNFMSTSFWGAVDNTISGILSITLKQDGSLQGNWISQSGKDTGTTTCTKSN
ncbi:hypothetical protein DGG96_02830 [Legionella qingyii]|uniref:Avidin n=1 Tax=Legionella qingyii TaxID=2184757 RepID=A0A317U3U6_9GAMM|nr:hypothetical protein [Legionella qingyii]PWY56381.1 hypothetical protein DGG96_06360 [Legionella qingyii]PWY57263.1 hypothetical protein DGG96_02830 [Legionella qingyii]RUR24896.1 hypothetical protein ELY20_03850 [Legionella qingyii]RUR28830.1 hypothetical protein ELY16_02130 [Legionella qingyii]